MLLFSRHSQNPLKLKRRLVIFKTLLALEFIFFIFAKLNFDFVDMACFQIEVLWFLAELDVFGFEHALDGFLGFEDFLVAYSSVRSYLLFINIVVGDPRKHKLL